MLERAVPLSQLSRLDFLKHQKIKKNLLPPPPTLKNQHGENYILVEESNKSWPNVAGEVEKGPPWRLQSQWCGSCTGGVGKPHKRRFVLALGRWGARGVGRRILGLRIMGSDNSNVESVCVSVSEMCVQTTGVYCGLSFQQHVETTFDSFRKNGDFL